MSALPEVHNDLLRAGGSDSRVIRRKKTHRHQANPYSRTTKSKAVAPQAGEKGFVERLRSVKSYFYGFLKPWVAGDSNQQDEASEEEPHQFEEEKSPATAAIPTSSAPSFVPHTTIPTVPAAAELAKPSSLSSPQPSVSVSPLKAPHFAPFASSASSSTPASSSATPYAPRAVYPSFDTRRGEDVREKLLTAASVGKFTREDVQKFTEYMTRNMEDSHDSYPPSTNGTGLRFAEPEPYARHAIPSTPFTPYPASASFSSYSESARSPYAYTPRYGPHSSYELSPYSRPAYGRATPNPAIDERRVSIVPDSSRKRDRDASPTQRDRGHYHQYDRYEHIEPTPRSSSGYLSYADRTLKKRAVLPRNHDSNRPLQLSFSASNGPAPSPAPVTSETAKRIWQTLDRLATPLVDAKNLRAPSPSPVPIIASMHELKGKPLATRKPARPPSRVSGYMDGSLDESQERIPSRSLALPASSVSAPSASKPSSQAQKAREEPKSQQREAVSGFKFQLDAKPFVAARSEALPVDLAAEPVSSSLSSRKAREEESSGKIKRKRGERGERAAEPSVELKASEIDEDAFEVPTTTQSFNFSEDASQFSFDQPLPTNFQFGEVASKKKDKQPVEDETLFSSSFKPIGAKKGGFTAPDADESESETEEEAPKEPAPAVPFTFDYPLPTSTPAASSSASSSAPAGDAECPVCGMGMEDADHSSCQEDEEGSGEADEEEDNKPAPAAFSFGDAGAGFSFGGSSDFSFGASASSSSSSETFSFGSSSAEPFSFGQTEDKKEKAEDKAPEKPLAAGSGKKELKPNKNGDCPICENSWEDMDHTDCKEEFESSGSSSAQSATPASSGFSFDAPSSTPAFSFGGASDSTSTFSFGGDAAASTPAFSFGEPASSSSSAATTTPAFSFGDSSSSSSSTPAFSFGESSCPAASTPAFTFGDSSSSSSSSSNSTPAFTFGDSSASSKPSEFSFGAAEPAKPKEPEPFSFGADTSSAPAPAFSFGSSDNAAPAPAAFSFDAPKQETSGFSFGQATTTASSSNFSFGSDFSAPSSASSSSFSFGGAGDSSFAPAPAAAPSSGFSFGNDSSSSMSSAPMSFNSEPAPFSFGGDNSASKPAEFSFGAAPSQPQSSPAPFEFGANSFGAPAPTPSFEPAPFSFGGSSNSAPSSGGFSFGGDSSSGFGAPPASNGGFQFGAAPQSSAPAPFSFGGQPSNDFSFGQAPPAAASNLSVLGVKGDEPTKRGRTLFKAPRKKA